MITLTSFSAFTGAVLAIKSINKNAFAPTRTIIPSEYTLYISSGTRICYKHNSIWLELIFVRYNYTSEMSSVLINSGYGNGCSRSQFMNDRDHFGW